MIAARRNETHLYHGVNTDCGDSTHPGLVRIFDSEHDRGVGVAEDIYSVAYQNPILLLLRVSDGVALNRKD